MFARLSSLRHGVPYGTFEQFAQRRDVFNGVAAFFGDGATIGSDVSASRVVGDRVTTGYFDVLGVHAAFGRTYRPTPFIYVPIEQSSSVLAASIVVRGRTHAPELLKKLPAAIVAAQPDAEVPRARTMQAEIDDALYPTRLGATVLALSGLFDLLLSVVGFYGVVS